VLPHGPLTKIADNLYTVTGRVRMPLGETTRHMTVVVLSGGRLAIYSAIAVDAAELARIEALGTPTYLIVPSGIHRLDVKAWKDRFPQLVVIAPRGALHDVTQVVRVDTTDTALGDPRVRLEPVPGTDERELSMAVDTGTGTTLVVNDLIFNLPVIPGIAGALMRLLGFGPGAPSMPKLVMKKLVRDKNAVRAQLREWASIGELDRLLVAHGAPIERPRETLLRLAERLA
jgi:hypothetical protein